MSREYKVGDNFRVIRKNGNIQHCFEIGQVVKFHETRFSSDRARFIDDEDVIQTVMFSDLEFLDTPEWEMEFPAQIVQIVVPHGMVIDTVTFVRDRTNEF